MKRRDIFINVAKPGHGDEARKYLAEWLRSLDGHPGYLGGSVLEEVAGELLPDTVVLIMEFESTEAARALWPKIENTPACAPSARIVETRATQAARPWPRRNHTDSDRPSRSSRAGRCISESAQSRNAG